MREKILITGGSGFIGSNFIKYVLKKSDCEIVNLDALTYAGNPENLSDIENDNRYTFVRGSVQNPELVNLVCTSYGITAIINFAAESHVDRSVLDPRPFIDTNVNGTLVLLQAAKTLNIAKYLQVSTDEVYGSLGAEGLFSEETNIKPNSPYSASKASADHLVQAYAATFGLPAMITRCSNNYGPYQFPEKLIPLMIMNAYEDKKLPVYGDGLNVRDWIHVEDHCRGIWTVFNSGRVGEVYNLGGNSERTNIVIVKTLLEILGKPESLIEYVKDRPGHDRRYAIDSSKIKNELGWEPQHKFETALEETVKWYLDNLGWGNRIRSGAYLDYYKKQYGK